MVLRLSFWDFFFYVYTHTPPTVKKIWSFELNCSVRDPPTCGDNLCHAHLFRLGLCPFRSLSCEETDTFFPQSFCFILRPDASLWYVIVWILFLHHWTAARFPFPSEQITSDLMKNPHYNRSQSKKKKICQTYNRKYFLLKQKPT